jgi:hypothetical protein
MNRYPQGWPVGYVEKIPAAGREHAIIRQRRVETALHSETTPATQLAKTQEDVLSPNESQAIRGRFIEVWARGANGISPGTKKFFAKTSFTQRLPPFMRAEPFLGKFLGEGP